MNALYGIITIAGPILLAAVMFWAMIKNKQRSQRQKDLTEKATRDLYNEPDGPGSGMKH